MKVTLERDSAMLYGVKTKGSKQSVKRNITRFHEDFMLQLTEEAFENLSARVVTSSRGANVIFHMLALPCSPVTSHTGKHTIDENLYIVREMLASHKALRRRIEELVNQMKETVEGSKIEVQ